MFHKFHTTAILLITCFLFYPSSIYAQKKIATITGKVLDENDKPLKSVSVQVLNVEKNTATNDSGYFQINVAANKPVALVFSFVGYTTVQKNFYLGTGENENITIKLQRFTKELKAVTVKDERDRRQPGLVNIDASRALVNPSPIGGIESLIKVFV